MDIQNENTLPSFCQNGAKWRNNNVLFFFLLYACMLLWSRRQVWWWARWWLEGVSWCAPVSLIFCSPSLVSFTGCLPSFISETVSIHHHPTKYVWKATCWTWSFCSSHLADAALVSDRQPSLVCTIFSHHCIYNQLQSHWEPACSSLRGVWRSSYGVIEKFNKNVVQNINNNKNCIIFKTHFNIFLS